MRGQRHAAIIALGATCVVPVQAHEVPPGFQLLPYAFVTDPVSLACDGAGVWFVGRDNTGSGGGDLDPTRIHRIGPGGTPVTEYGVPILADPDAVAFDGAGVISGVPGAVLVSGHGNGGGYLAAILPDQSVVTLLGPTETFIDVADMVFDSTGRLLLADHETAQVLVTSGGVPTVLFTLPAAPTSIDVDDQDRIYTGADDGTIRVHNPDGSVAEPAFATGLGAEIHLAVGPDDTVWGGALYAIADLTLWRFDTRGDGTALGAGFEAGALAFGGDGDLYNAFFEDDIVLVMSPIPGNLDGDGVVSTADLLLLLAAWGRCPAPPVSCPADLDGDGIVGASDLLLLLAAWSP